MGLGVDAACGSNALLPRGRKINKYILCIYIAAIRMDAVFSVHLGVVCMDFSAASPREQNGRSSKHFLTLFFLYFSLGAGGGESRM